jgi:predicted Zn-dependent protease
MLRKFIVTTVVVVLLVSCATSPLGRQQLSFMPASQMDSMGIEAFSTMKQETPVETDPTLNRYIRCVTTSLLNTLDTRGQQWEIVVFRDKDANAFALPGGKVGVYTGLLPIANNEHQLATVVGHEISHVLSNHSNERVSQQFALQMGMDLAQVLVKDPNSQNAQLLMAALGLGAQFGVLLPYSRIQETEADVLGLEIMARAGFDPRESIKLWQNMGAASQGQPPEFLSTHPSHESRITELNRNMGHAMQLYQQAHVKGANPRCK